MIFWKLSRIDSLKKNSLRNLHRKVLRTVSADSDKTRFNIVHRNHPFWINDLSNPNLIYPGQIIEIPQREITTPTKDSGTGGTFTYVIRYGNTLSGIAAKYHTTVSVLAGLNNISNPNLIYAGETIEIPQ